MMQDIIIITLVAIVIRLAISNALLRIKNDIVTAEIWLVREKLADKEEGDALIKVLQNWRDEDAAINSNIIGYDHNGSSTTNIDSQARDEN